MWEEAVSGYCREEDNDCMVMQDKPFTIPEYLMAEVEQLALQEIMTLGKIPSDPTDDSQNILR
jgi:hypothetical protein